jgi:hypothetical protein
LALDMRGVEFGPLRGIGAYVVLPGVLTLGLVMVAAATWWQRRARGRRDSASGGGPGRGRPPRYGRAAFALLSFAGIAIFLLLGAAGFRAVEFMESSTFCATCHSVMGPQVEAHKVSPHAEVACTACHIGPEAGPVGAGSVAYAKAKIGGMRQTLSTLTGHYDQPVRAAADKIPATNETCERCHAPENDYGVTVRVYRSYLADEANTPHRRVLAFRVGGGEGGVDVPAIHWHATARVWYSATDETRQTIAWTGVETEEGMAEWVNPDSSIVAEESRSLMNCTDCHNRVGHKIPFPGALVDEALRDGRLDASLPYLKREALALLGADGSGADVETQAVRTSSPGWFDELRRFYEREYPGIAATRAEAIDNAIAELKRISRETQFPGMLTNWATYPDNLQHSLPDGLDLDAGGSTPGCFRCHGTLVKRDTGERLAGTMGGEGCMACHGFGEGGTEPQLPAEPAGVEGCALCHVSVSNEDAASWLADPVPLQAH